MSVFRKMLARLMEEGMPDFQDKEGEETSPADKMKAKAFVVKKVSGDDEELSPEELAQKKKKLKRDISWEN